MYATVLMIFNIVSYFVIFYLIGDIKIGQNPTFYRSPCQYFSLLQKEVGGHSECDSGSVFQLLTANSVFAYVKVCSYLGSFNEIFSDTIDL